MATSTRLQLSSPFLQTVLKSGLLAPDDLFGTLAAYDPERLAAAEPIQIATLLVRKKLLTKFQAMQLLSGRTQGFVLGDYKIMEGLRQDRVGMVFLAEHAGTRRAVIVKVLPTDRVSDDTMYKPFLKEVRAAAQITHPTVARILDVGTCKGTHFVVCEYVAAPTLDKVVAEKGPLPPDVAAQVIAQTAVGLVHAHRLGLFHRDLKPANVALLPGRRVKLLDLGLTHLLDNPWARVTKRINLAEYAEEIAHIPPEQAWGCELDARSDVYSLGSTAYFLLTGRHPFPAPATAMMTERQLRGVPKPSAVRPDVPAELDELVQKMGAKDPHERFQTAAEVVAAFRPWLSAEDWAAVNVPAAAPKAAVAQAPPATTAAAKRPGFFARLFARLTGR